MKEKPKVAPREKKSKQARIASCPRAHFHRAGTYCKTCETLIS